MLCAMQMAVRPASVSRRACAPAAETVAVENACAAGCKALATAEAQHRVLDKLFDCWRRLLKPFHDRQELNDLQMAVDSMLVEFEEFSPRSEHNMCFHRMSHLVHQIKQYGPLRENWMFPFEAYMKVLKAAVKNKSKVEASAFERFINNSALSALESVCAQQNQTPLVKSGLVFGLPPGQEPPKVSQRNVKWEYLSSSDQRLLKVHALTRLSSDDQKHMLSVYQTRSDATSSTPMATLQDLARWYVSTEDQKRLTSAQLKALVNPPQAYASYHGATVKGFSFRTEAYERNMKFANCGVAAIMRDALPDGSSVYVKYYGKIQTILALPVPDETRQEVYFRVCWYNRLLVSPDPKCTGVQLIKATGSQSDFDSQQPYILASNVEHDVFFASVLGSIAGSQPWLWVMHYESSATVMPDIILSEDGEPVEIQ